MLNIKYKAYNNKKLKKIHSMINTSCWVWNHCIALQKRYYSLYGCYINVNKLQKHIAKLRNKNDKWKQLNSQTIQEICQRVDTAYQRFFKKISKRPPKFKKSINFSSFVLKQSGWSISHNKLTINKIGEFKFSKSREYESIKRITVKRDKVGDVYFVLTCNMEPVCYERVGNSAIGIDFGLKTYLTCSDGNKVSSPLFFKEQEKEIKKANKNLSSKKKGSNNRKKSLKRLQRIHKKIYNKREDFHWKLSHELCKNNSFIALEDLNLSGMKKLFGKKVSDLSFASFVLKLEYVSKKYDTTIQKIDRFFPSSKLCSCGAINKDLKLSDREWCCIECGTVHDRDLLASNNILTEGIRLYRTKCKTSFEKQLGLMVESNDL